ncbi:hypothetical protein NE235_33490 [Actinoallomurus spadix]|uniref:Peptidase n=1 Tax=Actinoallomurus spadix TaxID=79912 RepID=A0ABP3H226_9ACTN|nr:hypothetical protein [Actinoallomurus spadix]MCO5991037.1 hypothetical protein [Actinoallomurus spadix]
MPDTPALWRARAAALLTAYAWTGPAPAQVHATAVPEPDVPNSIAIGVADVPASRLDDPRARLYVDDHVNPGTTFTRHLHLYNTSDRPQHLRLYAGAARITRHRFTFPPPDAPGNELSSWIHLDHTTRTIPAHADALVTARFAVPDWAQPGERYAVIWAQVSSAEAGPHGNVTLVNQVGTRVYLHVGPGAEPPSDFRIGPLRAQPTPDGRHLLTATVTNTGQRAIDPEGRLWLTGGPSRLAAGPFTIPRGTTIAPGEQAPVTVPIGPDVPQGAWNYRLTLHSGRVARTATGTLTLAAKPTVAGGLAAFTRPSTMTLTLTLAGFLSAVLGGIVLIVRRLSIRRRPGAT